MNKWKITSIVLVVLLSISVIFSIGLYQAAKEEISSLQRKIVNGVHAEGDQLIIENASFSSVYIKPLGVYVLENGTRIFTKNRKFDLEIGFWGGIYSNDWEVVRIGRGIYSLALNLEPGDSLSLVWRVTNGTPENFVIRIMDDEGFKQYLNLMRAYSPGDMDWWSKLDDVLTFHQIAATEVKAGTGQGVSVGDRIRKAGVYHVVFDNEGNPVVMRVKLSVTKNIDVSAKS